MNPMLPTSAGIVIVRSGVKGIPDDARLLLLRAYQNWDFPKGLIEKGETPLQAAIREVEEETTLKDLRFEWGKKFFQTPPYSRNKIARYYLARAPQGAQVSLPISEELGRPEHHEFRWAKIDEATQLVGQRLIPVLEWAQRLLTLEL